MKLIWRHACSAAALVLVVAEVVVTFGFTSDWFVQTLRISSELTKWGSHLYLWFGFGSLLLAICAAIIEKPKMFPLVTLGVSSSMLILCGLRIAV